MRRFARRLALVLPLAALATLAVACVETPGIDPGPPPSVEPTATTAAPDATPEAPATPVDLTDAGVARLLRTAVCWHDDPSAAALCLPPNETAVGAIVEMGRSRDARFIAPLIDMLWMNLEWDRWTGEALERITGRAFATAREWYDWYATQQTDLPQGYAEWKGRLLSIVDPRFTELVNASLERSELRPDELIWALVRPNGIPPLVTPEIVHRVEQRYLSPLDTVYGIVVGDEARAYPQRILAWHEVVRDVVAGQPVIVTACVPCGGAIAYRAEASDGERYTLGNSGLVYRSRRLLFDEETHSLWDVVSGEAVVGPLAERGVRLSPLPLIRTTWREWTAREPNTQVLDLETGVVRDYGRGVALREDAASDLPIFPTGPLDDRLDPKELVLGLRFGDEDWAWPLDELEGRFILNTTVGGRRVVIISEGSGLGVHVYDGSGITITRITGGGLGRIAIDDDGGRWFMDDTELVSTLDGRVRRVLSNRMAYWFAWADVFPETTLRGR